MEQYLSKKKISEFTEVFCLFAKDVNGRITYKELDAGMKSLGEDPTDEELKVMIQEADSDGDGVIGLTDFLNLMARQMKEELEKEAEEAFCVCDKDHKGFISMEELHRSMINFGEKVTSEEVQTMFGEADEDGDGKITGEEFVKVLMPE